jgi:hypothetical protein
MGDGSLQEEDPCQQGEIERYDWCATIGTCTQWGDGSLTLIVGSEPILPDLMSMSMLLFGTTCTT